MTSVEVQSPPPPPPPPPSSDDTEGGSDNGSAAPATTYEWLASVPVLSSAGNTVYTWYEGSKNYTRASKYALDSVESSVKYVAGTAASVVQGPMTAVDSFTVKQLVKLEEKVPSIKTDTDEVLENLDERKKAVYTRIHDGKEAAKDAIATRLVNGKDVIVGCIQAGTEAVANSTPGTLVSGGVNRTLKATENIVDYLIPEKPEDVGLPGEEEKKTVTLKMTIGQEEEKEVEVEEEDSSDEEEEEEGGEGGEEEVKEGESNVERVKNISRKVKVRVYYRTLRRLDGVQEQCKTALEHLKLDIDLLKMAHGTYEKVDKQYKQLQSSLRSVRQHLGSLVTTPTSPQTTQDPLVTLLDDEGEEVKLENLTPTQKATMFQGVLDYARQLSEKVYTAFQSVSTATTFLPHHLKDGASHALQVSQELYTTLKSAKVPTDIPTSVLNKTSEVIDTQLGYVKQLGTYIKTALKAKEKSGSTKTTTEPKTLLVPDQQEQDGSSSSSSSDGEGEPPTSRPPGSAGEPPLTGPPVEQEEDDSGDEN